jgi:hypothetical protein
MKVYIHNSYTRSHPSEDEIALEIAAKIASVNGQLIVDSQNGNNSERRFRW